MKNDRSELEMKLNDLERNYLQRFPPGSLSKTTQSLADRIRRAMSWFKRAQLHPSDLPPRYVDLWISLNALYGVAPPKEKIFRSELTDFQNFSKCLLDTSEKASELNNLMNNREVFDISKDLVANKYLCKAFWGYSHGNHTSHIESDLETLNQAPSAVDFFSPVFSRLLVLRNQIFHGSSSSATLRNEDVLVPGCRLLEIWLPTFMDLMLSCTHGKEGMWPRVPYPGRGSPQHPKPQEKG